MTANACGSCTLCCKLMAVDELAKPRGQWCGDCRVGSGCARYASRPDACRDFACVWLQAENAGRSLGAELRPDRCRVMLTPTNDGQGIVAHVDPGMPHAHERGAIAETLARLVAKRTPLIIVCGDRRKAYLPEMPAELLGVEYTEPTP